MVDEWWGVAFRRMVDGLLVVSGWLAGIWRVLGGLLMS